MERRPWVEPARRRGTARVRAGVLRFRLSRWQVVQCAAAAAVAWFVAAEVLGHPAPVFAPIAAVVSLGTSYSQRLRRVGEVAAGVAVGVLLGDLLVLWLGSGPWQIGLVVGLAMSIALVLDAGTLFVNQAAIQAVFVAALTPGADTAFTRWTDALVGGAVALLAATVVPAAPLRRPREQAAVVLAKVAELLRAAAAVMVDDSPDAADVGLELLADARATDDLVHQLRRAADEGMAVVSSSPFRVRHRPGIRRMVDLVDPLDRALRGTRVLVRQTAVGAYRHRPMPAAYAALVEQLADAVDVVVGELLDDVMAVSARPALLAVGATSAEVPRAEELSAEVVLAQVRSITADLLVLTGLDTLEATDAIPERHRGGPR